MVFVFVCDGRAQTHMSSWADRRLPRASNTHQTTSNVAALKTLATNCNFGVLPIARTPPSNGDGAAVTMESVSLLSESTMLPDRFVCGICNSLLQQRLLAEQDWTFHKAFDIADRSESAAKHQESRNV